MAKLVTGGDTFVDTTVTVRDYAKNGLLQKETLFEDDTRAVKLEEVVYTYQGTKLVKREKSTFHGPVVAKHETTEFFEETLPTGERRLIEKRS